jgi:hypothetical protein
VAAADALTKGLVAAALCSALCGGPGHVLGQETRPALAATSAEPPAAPDIVVEGRRVRELRLRIRLAEDAIHARFNDLNSTDDFDIHCRDEQSTGTHLTHRVCPSNSWREQDANFADAQLRNIRGESGGNPYLYRAEQLRMQQLLTEELRRLAHEDEALGRAISQWAEAQLELAQRTGRRPDWTMSHAVAAGEQTLPYDALRKVEVRIGAEAWSHKLTHRTFTIAHVTGEIRGLALDCLEGDTRLDYQPDVEWTLPANWSSCILAVRAKKNTTFALYEF